jgi:two-component system, cell cycle sensor histidine kinase and response regulator CckA
MCEAKLIVWSDINGMKNKLKHAKENLKDEMAGSQRMEEDLRASEEKYRVIFDNEIYAIYILDLETLTFLDVNEAFINLYGYSRGDLLAGMTIHDITIEHRETDTAMQKAFREGTLFIPLRYHKKKDGTIFPVEVVVRPFIQKGQKVMFGLLHDISERRQAEEALRRSEERFRLAMEATSDGLYEADMVTGERYLSPAYFRMLGYEPGEFDMTTEAWLDLMHPDDREFIMKINEDYIENRAPTLEGEFRLRGKDGNWKWIFGRAKAVIRDASGKAIRIVGTQMDITERKQVENVLRENEERYRELYMTEQRQAREMKLLERVQAAVAGELDLDAVIRSVVEEIAETFHYTLVSLYLRSGDVLELQHQVGYREKEKLKEIPITKGVIGRVARSRQPVLVRDVRSDPDYISVIDDSTCEVCVPLVVHNQVVGALNVESRNEMELTEADLRLMTALGENVSIAIGRARLYTELREREAALRQSEEKFNKAFHYSPLAMALSTLKDGKFLDVNDAFLRMTERTRDEVLGHTVSELGIWAHPEQRSQIVEQLTKYGRVVNAEFMIRSKSGKILPVLWSAEKVEINSEEYMLSLALDLSERRNMEKALIESERMAGIGTLAGGMAHEINTPLQVITGTVDNLRRKLKDGRSVSREELERKYDSIYGNAWRIADIVRSLVEYTRSVAEGVEECSLNDVVQRAIKLTVHQFKSASNITISTNLAGDMPLVECDANKIVQVLVNLLVNARDAMPSGGPIDITTGYDVADQRVRIWVKDSGKGIPAEIRGKIFDPFFTTKPMGEGKGLGLSTAMGIARTHGGEVELVSSSEEGSVFCLSLPVHMPEDRNDTTPGRY